LFRHHLGSAVADPRRAPGSRTRFLSVPNGADYRLPRTRMETYLLRRHGLKIYMPRIISSSMMVTHADPFSCISFPFRGSYGIRTRDLLAASQLLYQPELSPRIPFLAGWVPASPSAAESNRNLPMCHLADHVGRATLHYRRDVQGFSSLMSRRRRCPASYPAMSVWSPGAVATRHLPGVSCILNDPGINLISPAGR
jgi:hypothetical protein